MSFITSMMHTVASDHRRAHDDPVLGPVTLLRVAARRRHDHGAVLGGGAHRFDPRCHAVVALALELDLDLADLEPEFRELSRRLDQLDDPQQILVRKRVLGHGRSVLRAIIARHRKTLQ
jgi:hypothetical protein